VAKRFLSFPKSLEDLRKQNNDWPTCHKKNLPAAAQFSRFFRYPDARLSGAGEGRARNKANHAFALKAKLW
jgi:hypothetical protein